VNKRENHIDELIARLVAGEATAADHAELEHWRQQSPANDQQIKQWMRAYELSGLHYQDKPPIELNIDLDVEWTKLNDRIQSNVRPNRSLSIALVWKVAAAVILFTVSAALVYFFVFNTSDLRYETQANTQEIVLPDGSKVVLNRFSSLVCHASFNEADRKVTLQGEAYFDVTRDPHKPFRIFTQTGLVEVLGTSFTVSQSRDLGMEVIVTSGLVSFEAAHQQVRLKAGERARYYPGKPILPIVNTDPNYLAWKTRELIFEATPLETVVETLQRTYGVTIELTNSVSATCQVTARFSQQSLESIMIILENTLHLTVQTEEGKWIITKTGC
jgi:transmembrane sensor